MAQEQLGASSLEAIWLPALADGLRAGGHADIADRVWPPDRSSDVTIRMAYYGDLFLAAGTMGGGGAEPPTVPEQAVAETFAAECLQRAAQREVPDQRAAAKQL